MKLKQTSSLLLGLGLTVVLSASAWAHTLNARVKAVNPDANTITVTAKKQDSTITVNGDTHFLNEKGEALADGIKSGDLKPGTRLAITYTKTNDQEVASEIKLRGAAKAKKAKAPATPASPAPTN